jgi:hypothetical protein
MSEVRTFWRSRTGRVTHLRPNCRGLTLHPIEIDANDYMRAVPTCENCWPGSPWVEWPGDGHWSGNRYMWVDR